MKNKKTTHAKEVKTVEAVAAPEKNTTTVTKSNNSHASISSGISLILLGITFLGTTQGWFTWGDVFTVFIHYWPIAVILWGLKLVLSTWKVPRFLVELIDILFPAFVLAVLFFKPAVITIPESNQITPAADIALYQSSQQKAITERKIDLTLGAVEFSIADTDTTPGLLFSATQPNKDRLLSYSETTDEKGTYTLAVNNGREVSWTFSKPSWKVSHKMQIGSQTIPTSLNLRVGATQGDIKISQTNLKEVAPSLGAGDVSFTSTTGQQPSKVTISVGAGNAEFSFPESYNLKVNYSVGAGSVSINGKEFGGLAAKGEYQTNSYAEKTIEVFVTVGAGSVKIKGD